MPGQDANRLSREHQQRLAQIADLIAADVRRIARRADTADIDGWWSRIAESVIALVAAAWRTVLELTQAYLVDHARAEGREVDPVLAEWVTEQVVTSLRVTGPVAFKEAIRAGHTEEKARTIMGSRLAGAAERLVLNADRETVMATVEASNEIVGWRRVSDGDPCAWCAMLISRGAVYRSGRTAGDIVFGGTEYHDGDRCRAEPLYEHEPEPAEVADLYRQWLMVTAGKSGADALRAWRQYWENQPTERDPEPARTELPRRTPGATFPEPQPPGPNAADLRVTAIALEGAASIIERTSAENPGIVQAVADEQIARLRPYLAHRPDLVEALDAIPQWAVAPERLRDLARRLLRPPERDRLADVDGESPLIGELIPHDRDDVAERRPEIIEAVRDRLNGIYAGFEVSVYSVEPEPGRITIFGSIFDDTGRNVGFTERRFYRGDDGTLWVYHAFLKLDESVQGQGFAQTWNAHLEQWYRESGLAYIKLTANIDVGGYTWSRQGYGWADMIGPREIANRLDRLLDAPFDQESLAAAEAMVERLRRGNHADPDFPTPYEVGQLGRRSGQGRDGMWIGKAALLGSTWRGIKWLTT